MKHIILILTLFSTTILFGQKKIEVEINKNIEFISLCSWLIDFGQQYENKQSKFKDYQYFQFKAYQEFKKFKNDPLLDSFKKADKNEGLSSYIYLFSQLKDFPKCSLESNIEQGYYLKHNDSLNNDEARLFTEKVIKDLNSFYKKINFNNFWESNSNYYDKMIEEVQNSLPKEHFIPLMEDFYQQETFNEYKLIPSLMIPSGMGFGPTLNNVAYNFFGSFDGADKTFTSLGFGHKDKLIELSTHEYGHSFVNHIVDELTDSIYIKETEVLFEPIKKSMWKQGYIEWKACLYEHFVRAGEIIIAKNLDDKELEKELKEKYMTERNFIYLPIILKYLNEYNDNRDNLHYIDAMKYALEDLKNYR